MKRSNTILLILFGLGFIALFSCQKDEEEECCDPTNPECINYDPCFGKEEPNASFFTEDRLIYPEFGEYLWIHDSILRGGLVRFRSPFEGEGITHKWYIGSEIIEEPSVIRSFNNVPRPETIVVSHVITYPSDSLCYPQADGRDSVVQAFHLIDYYNELLTIDRTFRGVTNSQPDSFDFKLRALQSFSGEVGRIGMTSVNLYGINFLNNQDSSIINANGFTNTHFSIYDSNLQGLLLVIDPSDMSVKMNYNLSEDGGDQIFLGRVLPE